ncbi:MAG: hypothetical protein Q9186_005441 [Xanthomendoza sp. 1 TL-2023]
MSSTKTWDVTSNTINNNDNHSVWQPFGDFDFSFSLWDPPTRRRPLYHLALRLTPNTQAAAPWHCTGLLIRRHQTPHASYTPICWVKGDGTIEKDSRGIETLRLGFVIDGATQHPGFRGIKGGGGMVVTLPGGEPPPWGLVGRGTCVLKVENEAGVSVL